MTLSMYVLEGELEQTHLNCWHLFVRAFQILVSPMLTIEEAEQGHDLLVKFCIEFERLYGIEKVTPTAPQHLVCRAVQSLHINHMQTGIIEVFICRRLHMNTSMILICIWLVCRLCTALHTKCCGAVSKYAYAYTSS